jgi:ATP-dependent 26S proteasome regulatory subunit
MTTNDEGTIPPELYRAGRIDYAIEFKKLSRDSADSFIEILSDNLKHIYEMSQKERADILQKLYGLNLTEYSHAEITQKVMGEIKIEFLKNQNI